MPSKRKKKWGKKSEEKRGCMPELRKQIFCIWIRRPWTVRPVDGFLVSFSSFKHDVTRKPLDKLQNAFFGKISRSEWVKGRLLRSLLFQMQHILKFEHVQILTFGGSFGGFWYSGQDFSFDFTLLLLNKIQCRVNREWGHCKKIIRPRP